MKPNIETVCGDFEHLRVAPDFKIVAKKADGLTSTSSCIFVYDNRCFRNKQEI